MGDEFYFEKLDVYKESITLASDIYKLTKDFPKEEMYGLVSQLRRASVSVISNICEGSSRGKTEFKRYLDIARGSIFECVGQLKISLNLGYIKIESYDCLYSDCIKLSKMVMGLKKSIS